MPTIDSKPTPPISPRTLKLQPTPKPLPPELTHAALLESLVDPLPSIPSPTRYRPESVSRFVTQWVESGSEPKSYQERHRKSATPLRNSCDDPVPKRLTMSAPAIELVEESPPHSKVDFCAKSVGKSIVTATASGSNRQSERLVMNPLYRDVHLTSNNIYLRSHLEQLPEHISCLIDQIGRDRNSPGPSADDLWQDENLAALEMDAPEADVQDYFQTQLFLHFKGALKRSNRLPMARGVVPDAGSSFMLSTPTPDMLYGYNLVAAFTGAQQTQLASMMNEITVNSRNLMFPFFAIEFKAEGAPGGLSVATNQCLGGSASCVNIAERLNFKLRQCKHQKVTPINSAAFSIALNGTEARLFVSWKHDELEYYTRKVNSFLLQRPEHYIEFRKHVLNIIDWGKEERLQQIQISLESLLEETRMEASQQAKSRTPPSLGRAKSSRKKHKPLRD